jgi:hypothetical protein
MKIFSELLAVIGAGFVLGFGIYLGYDFASIIFN